MAQLGKEVVGTTSWREQPKQNQKAKMATVLIQPRTATIYEKRDAATGYDLDGMMRKRLCLLVLMNIDLPLAGTLKKCKD